jgi:ketosteroid isomerase-like protein
MSPLSRRETGAADAAGHPLIDAFARGDARGAREAMAPDAVFHSPVADYRGRDQIAPVLDALTRVVRVTANVAVHRDDAETVWFFTADVEGERADGVLRVVAERDAPAGEVTLMIRPLDALLAGVKAMGRAFGKAG